MIGDYFRVESAPIITEFYELHRGFIQRHEFTKLFKEMSPLLTQNASRRSCVLQRKFTTVFPRDDQGTKEIKEVEFSTGSSEQKQTGENGVMPYLYNLPSFEWTPLTTQYRNKIEEKENCHIDYVLVHYYHDEKAVINWHSDSEALTTNIYSISIGGTRRFCLRDKITHKMVYSVDLFDGDLFIMKVGCQERFEHCIKSIKSLNQPRISMTFRQFDENVARQNLDNKPITNFILNSDYTVSLSTYLYGANFVGEIQTDLALIRYYTKRINPIELVEERTTIENKTDISIPLLKSNLQKAVRRKNVEIAVQTAKALINANSFVELLRRLTIISFEDVKLTNWYSTIVWFYVATTKHYILSAEDIDWILSYTKMLCQIDEVMPPPPLTSETVEPPTPRISSCLGNSVVSFLPETVLQWALYIRIQYGGFDGEIRWMKHIINSNQISIEVPFQIETFVNSKLYILNVAIDFHCYPQMLGYIREKTGLNQDAIRDAIWEMESSVNYRNKNIKNNNAKDVWSAVEPLLNEYRKMIMNYTDRKEK